MQKKASWHDGGGLCWFIGLAIPPTELIMIDDLPELMDQRPRTFRDRGGLTRHYGFWWPKWNIWQRRIVIRRAIKMVKLAES